MRSAAFQRLAPAPVDVGIAALGGAAAVLAGYALVKGPAPLAYALAALPVLALLLHRPTVTLVLLGASLPVTQSVPGMPAGYNAAISDLLMVVLLTALVARWATSGQAGELRTLRPLGAAVVPYVTTMVMVLALHLGVGGAAQTLQRFELFLVPLVIGVVAYRSGRHVPLLVAYVVSSSALAVLWPLGILIEGQKNPVGQFIGNAILLLVGLPALRRYLPLLVVLVPGLFVTESRGAILATAAGVVVVMLMQGLGVRLLLLRVVPLAVAAAIAFVLMPAETRDRVTTLSASTDTRAGYAIKIRQDLADDAGVLIAKHPWTGAGIGNYPKDAAASNLPAIEDPHQVILLEAVEGGYLLAAAFALMIVGTTIVLARYRRHPFAPAAAAVFVATALHGLVDVYWVRGTPVLGWLLVGIACAAAARARPQGVRE